MSTPEATAERPPEGWLTRRERGTVWGIRSVFWLATLFGRWPARQLVRVIAFWYFVIDRSARAVSRQWLETVHGRPVTLAEVYGHIHRFAQVTLDRLFLAQDKISAFEVGRNGHEHLAKLAESKTGAILLGAHLGSFEALRADGSHTSLPINIVGHFANAKMINALISDLNADAAARVLHVGDDPFGLALRMQEKLQAGEMVAILGDRTGLNAKSVEVEFFGRPAMFPAGPLLLAATMKCPVYLVFGLYYEPNRYELHCEPFAERIELPRNNRGGALRDAVQAYAHRLEEYARMAPDNWFNFFDFWNAGR